MYFFWEMEEKENIVLMKSEVFSDRIILLNKFLKKSGELIMSNQILRSGTAVGALIAESKFAQSKADFLNKMNVSLKEANETCYWLRKLKTAGYFTDKAYDSIYSDANEMVSLLAAIVKSTRKSLNAINAPKKPSHRPNS